MRTRIKYSQNFLKDRGLIKSLLEKSSINKQDVVYEIGAGQGIITEELLKRSGRVIAFEIDENLYNKLTQRFSNELSLELKLGNFLSYHLPNQPYKVFSNIPFNITSTIVKKLTQADRPPKNAYLIMQKEAANKFIGKPEDKSNSLLSILIKSQFSITIFHRFNRNDFFPRPNIDVVMLQIQERNKPLISAQDRLLFFDYVTYAYSQFKPNILKGLSAVMNENNIIGIARLEGFAVTSKPSQLELKNWIVLFQSFKKYLNERQKSIIAGAYLKLQAQQNTLQKIHRTRTDKDWKKFS